jgi:hypothetical protein
MPNRDKTGRALLALLLLNVFASVVHYIDNVLRWSAYPEPTWLTAPRTDAFWFVMTPVAALTYLLYRRGSRAWTTAAYVYAWMGSLTLGHYLYAPPWRMTLAINANVLFEGLAAVWLAVFAWRNQPPLAPDAALDELDAA